MPFRFPFCSFRYIISDSSLISELVFYYQGYSSRLFLRHVFNTYFTREEEEERGEGEVPAQYTNPSKEGTVKASTPKFCNLS